MVDRKLNIAFWNYDRTRALADGTMTIPGVEATFHSARIVAEIFEGVIRGEFDVSELYVESDLSSCRPRSLASVQLSVRGKKLRSLDRSRQTRHGSSRAAKKDSNLLIRKLFVFAQDDDLEEFDRKLLDRNSNLLALDLAHVICPRILRCIGWLAR